jgi:hypothetical protein
MGGKGTMYLKYWVGWGGGVGERGGEGTMYLKDYI